MFWTQLPAALRNHTFVGEGRKKGQEPGRINAESHVAVSARCGPPYKERYAVFCGCYGGGKENRVINGHFTMAGAKNVKVKNAGVPFLCGGAIADAQMHMIKAGSVDQSTHPLRPAMTTPRMMKRWKIRKNTSVGRVDIAAPVMISSHATSASSPNDDRPTGRV